MSLKIFIVTRNSPQHFALIDAIQDTKTLCGGVIQTDENDCMKQSHVAKLVAATKKSVDRYFGVKYSHMSNVKTIAIKGSEMNNENTIDFINSQSPDIVLFFDNERLSDENIAKINAKKWQLFLGNTEENKGYFSNIFTSLQEKPESTCITLHEMVDNSDNGNIIHQTSASLRDFDSVHDHEARSIRVMLNDIEEIVTHEKNNTLQTKTQNNVGNFNNASDLSEDMVNTLFDKYNNNIYKYKLDNAQTHEQPITQIELFKANAK